MPVDLEAVHDIIEKHGYEESSLLAILQDIQYTFNYLPQKALREVSRGMNIPLSHIYAIATFYKAFSLKPRGRHSIHVCLGTACHVRGGQRILECLERKLGVKSGGTSEDLTFTLERVNCLGACAMGPMMVVDQKYMGKVKLDKIDSILKPYK
jgi:NADH-quinone oxidoreductase subunit E